MRYLFFVFVMFFLVSILLSGLQTLCEAKGGTVVVGLVGPVCVAKEVIK